MGVDMDFQQAFQVLIQVFNSHDGYEQKQKKWKLAAEELQFSGPEAGYLLKQIEKFVFSQAPHQDLIIPSALASPAHPDKKSLGLFYNNTRYQIVLLFCKLANLYEEKGNPEEHALKLSLLFDTPQSALYYLKKTDATVHDICSSIHLPDIHKVDFAQWKDFFKLYQDNPKFLTLLTFAAEIERIIDPHFSEQTTAHFYDVYLLLEQLKEYKEQQANYSMLNETQKKQCDLFRSNLPRLYSQLALAVKGTSLSAMNFDLLNACYEHFKSQLQGTEHYLAEQGLNSKDYSHFLSLARKENDQLIPAIEIDGASLGHPGYYLMKIPVLNEQHAARAACLGQFTKSGQSLRGRGIAESQVVQGLTQEDQGFYILCQGDLNASLEDKIQHKIIAHVIAGRSQSDAIIFRPIETAASSSQEPMIIKMFSELAKTLVSQHHTVQVLSEIRLDISNRMGVEVKGYKFERFNGELCTFPTTKQRLLAHEEKPYLVSAIDSDYQEKTQQLIELNLKKEGDLIRSTFLSELINWALFERNDSVMHLLEQKALVVKKDKELKEIIAFSKKFIWGDPNPDEILLALVNNYYTPTLVNQYGDTVLHRLVDNPQALDKMLIYLTLSEYLATIKITNHQGYSAIHYAAHNDSLKIILGVPYLPAEKRLEIIKIQDNTGRLVLHCAVNHLNNLKMILDLYPQEERVQAVLCQDIEGNTVFHYARKHPESFKMLLNYLPKEEWPKLLNLRNNAGDNVLHKMQSNPCIQILLTSFAESERKALVQQKNKVGLTVIASVAHDYETLYSLFISLPENERLSALKLIINSDNSLVTFNILKLINYLPVEDRLEALGLRDQAGHTVLNYAANSPVFLRKVLASLPDDQCFQAIKLCGKSGNMFLHSAARFPHLLKVILRSLSEEESFQALTLKSKSGHTILHYAAKSPDLLKICFDSISEHDKIKALTTTNKSGVTLIESIHHPDSVKIVTELLSRHNLTKAKLLERTKVHKPSLYSPLTFFGASALNTLANVYATQKDFRGGQRFSK